MTVEIRENSVFHVPATVGRRAPLPRVLCAVMMDPGDKFGSMEEHIVYLAGRFREEGGLYLPLFITDQTDAGQFHKFGVHPVCLPLQRFSWRRLWQLRRLIRQERIEIINWNFMSSLSNSYLWALSLLTPTVRHWYTDHDSRQAPPKPARGLRRLVKRLFLKRYEQVLCVSQFVRECLEIQGVWSNLACTPHFINTHRFRPDTGARTLMRQSMQVEDRFVLLAVAYLIKDKGIDVAVRAMTKLPDHVVLWIVGQGPEDNALKALTAELGLVDRVRLLGLQKHVQPFMQAADCILCPSLWNEAAGLVNLEAQACGKPVIASRIGGIPQYVIHGETGLLFTPGWHEELAQSVRLLADDPELHESMSRRARDHALEHFSPEAASAAWLDLYRRDL